MYSEKMLLGIMNDLMVVGFSDITRSVSLALSALASSC